MLRERVEAAAPVENAPSGELTPSTVAVSPAILGRTAKLDAADSWSPIGSTFAGGLLGYARSMRISEELFAPVSPGIELCYQTFGDPDDEPLLLVMGLGGPMTWWDPDLCRMLAERGFYVIRYDNRDTGRSSRAQGRVTRGHAGAGVRRPAGAAAVHDGGPGRRRLRPARPPRPRVAPTSCGVSMGGMIVQTMAIARTRSGCAVADLASCRRPASAPSAGSTPRCCRC